MGVASTEEEFCMTRHIPGNNKKEKNIKYHFKMRMLERYGEEVFNSDIDNIIAAISRGESKFIRKQSRTHSSHQVMFRDKLIQVVYDKVRKSLVTVLPPKNG